MINQNQRQSLIERVNKRYVDVSISDALCNEAQKYLLTRLTSER